MSRVAGLLTLRPPGGWARHNKLDIGAFFPSFTKDRYLLVWNTRLYLDDSGSQDGTGAFVIGGWVAKEKQWRRFEREWQRALEDAGMSHFHATDFYNRKNAPYKDWSLEKHIQFAKRFTAIAEHKQHTLMGIGRGVDLSAYQDLVLPENLFHENTPHGRFPPKLFCAQTCLEGIAREVGPFLPQGEKIAVVFEDGDGIGEMIEWCLWLTRHVSWGSVYTSFTPGPKSFLPLQAADLLAHETWRYLKEHIGQTGRPQRKSFQRLIKNQKVSIRAGTRQQFSAVMTEIKRFAETPATSFHAKQSPPSLEIPPDMASNDKT